MVICFSYDKGIDLVFGELISRGSLSIHKHVGSLNCQYTPEQILKEILRVFAELASDIKPKVFKEASSLVLFLSILPSICLSFPFHHKLHLFQKN